MFNQRITIVLIATALFMLCPLLAKAQGDSQLSNMWKEYNEAQKKDLPQTCLKILDKISKKSESEKNYASLLKAEMARVDITDELAPDSMTIVSNNLLKKVEQIKGKDKVAYAIFNLALYKSSRTLKLNDDSQYLKEAFADMDILANTKTDDWSMVVNKQDASEVFNHDMLSLMGLSGSLQKKLYNYYKEHGNRRACAYLARYNDVYNSMDNLSQYVEEYKDLPEGAHLAKMHYDYCMHLNEKEMSAADKYALLQTYRKQWAGTKEADIFENLEKEQQRANLRVLYVPETMQINKEKEFNVEVKNVSKAKITIIPLKAAARDIPRNMESTIRKYYEKLIADHATKEGNGYKGQIELTKDFTIENCYTTLKEKITIPGLPAGVYMLKLESLDEKDKPSYKEPNGFEVSTNQTHTTDYELLYVSNLKILRLALPNNKERQVVVDYNTGHEIKDAKIVTDRQRGMAAYTATDNGMPYVHIYNNNFRSSNPHKEDFKANIYLDRHIYRPGQTVHVAGILHKITDGVHTSVVPNRKVTITLTDANYQEIAEKEVKSDEFGTVSAEFVLPTDRLTGRWSINLEDDDEDDGDFEEDIYFQVEEYKRPTFEVTFKKYEKEYQLGDTIKITGVAKTYSGVPVANSKVEYTVMRRMPWWCWWRTSYSDNESKKLAKDSVVTNDKGEFEVTVPLSLPNGVSKDDFDEDDIVSYQYSINATVTNLSGESHEGETSVTASNKPLIVKLSISEKFLNTEDPKLAVTVRNNAGQEMSDAKLSFKIDDKAKQYSNVEDVKAAIKALTSGEHKLTLEASYNNYTDRDTTYFTIFSLDDKTPVEKTKHWTYITHTQFKNESDVISLQFGSSAEDVEIFYDVFVGDEHKESTVLHTSNSLIRKDFKAVKGKNILVVYAWVKDGEFYSNHYCLNQAEPEKSLKLSWKTFRDKLLPGQKEEWTLNITNPREKNAGNYQLLASMYDKSLDAIVSPYINHWNTHLGMSTGYMGADWAESHIPIRSLDLYRIYKTATITQKPLSRFNLWPFDYSAKYRHYGRYDVLPEAMPMLAAGGAPNRSMSKAMRYSEPVVKYDSEDMAMADDNDALQEVVVVGYGVQKKANLTGAVVRVETTETTTEPKPIQMRSNFSETAFFYPQLFADKNGDVSIKFTLPESTTTWKFRAIAHDKEMNNGMIQEEVIAQKQLMISPNMPRFIRKGDKGVLASVVSNLSEKTLNTKTTIEIIDPETEKVLYTESTTNTLEAGKTAPVNFNLNPEAFAAPVSEASASDILPLYIVKIFTEADGYSDGEQHYLAVIDNVEPVMTTKSITMIKPGTETVTTADLFPADATDKKLTVEWTENPAWLMLETLPYMNSQDQTTIYSKAAAYYANALGANILKAMPENTKQTILRQNEFGSSSSATVPEASASGSPLEKNPELKTLLLNETPWVMDAKNETERIKMLRNFYDENKLTYNQEQLIKKLKDEQKSDGGWSWCPDMQTSYWMTSEICELFVRLNNMIGKQEATSDMLKKALNCLQKKAHEEIIQWKKDEKNGVTPYIYDCYALQYVYLKALSGDNLTKQEKADADFVIKYLKKQERQNSLYMKAKLAIVLYYMGETKMAKEYIQSINEYSAYKELDGRYFDTRRAGYSWRDYKQPTQTMVIEALKAITPNDQQTIAEYQRWLLMQKRNQMWDTPINTVNNVYAFVSPSRTSSGKNTTKAPASTKSAPVSEASASDYAIINAFSADGKGYSKNIYVDKNILPIVEFEKTNNQVSWGAVYAQFKQKATNISDFSEGLKITREVISPEGTSLPLVGETEGVSVGDKVKVRITVVADRDYDFVQIVDKRAACLEPVSQTSGYRWASSLPHREGWGGSGYYEAPQDSRTCYYCDMLRKGTHTFETEYFIDRVGDYQSGTCTVQCAYSPEFYGRTGAININVTP